MSTKRRYFLGENVSIESRNGKIEFALGNQSFDFSPDAIKAALAKPRWEVNSDDFDDDSETGASIMRSGKSDAPTIAIFDNGKRVDGDTFDMKELQSVLGESRLYNRRNESNRITLSQLRRIIKEEVQNITEAIRDPDHLARVLRNREAGGTLVIDLQGEPVKEGR